MNLNLRQSASDGILYNIIQALDDAYMSRLSRLQTVRRNDLHLKSRILGLTDARRSIPKIAHICKRTDQGQTKESSRRFDLRIGQAQRALRTRQIFNTGIGREHTVIKTKDLLNQRIHRQQLDFECALVL